MLPRTGPLTEALRRLRVGYTGTQAVRWLGREVSATDVDVEWQPSGEGGNWLDVLVVEKPESHSDQSRIDEITESTRSFGTRSIAFVSEPGHEQWSSQTDITVGVAGSPSRGTDIDLPPLVDLSVVSPVGSLAAESTDSLAAFSCGPRSLSRRADRRFRKIVGIDTGKLTVDALDPCDIAPLLNDLRQIAGIVDHRDLHKSDQTRSLFLAQLAVASIPFSLLDEPSEPVRAAIGTELIDAASVPVDALLDREERRRISVRQRRIGLDRFGDWNRWREIAAQLDIPLPDPPTVSVLLATKRPDHLEHAVRQLLKQTYRPLEPIVILHGEGFPQAPISELKRAYPNTTIVHASTSETYGRVLNAGFTAATGALVSKWDDDDWYAREHLTDLVTALEYSGADLVGKAAEWIYLAERDITLRRNNRGAEQSGKVLVAGGSLLMRRTDLKAVGGFQRVRRYEDLGLKLDIEAAGGTRYRTHGFGFILHRHTDGHTWDSDIEHFLKNTSIQLDGFAAEAAMVDT